MAGRAAGAARAGAVNAAAERTRRQPNRPWSWSVAPADLGARVGGDALDSVNRLVGHQRDTGVVEVEALGRRRLRTPAGDLGDRLHSEGRHLERVLLRRRPDDAALDTGDPCAAAVDRDDDRGLAGGLEGRVGTDGGRLVDGVDDVD